MSLSHEKVGELRVGRDFIPTHYNSIYFDPFNANGVARAGNLTFAGAGTGPLPTGITGSNTVSYWLPAKLGGFYGMAMIGTGENARRTALYGTYARLMNSGQARYVVSGGPAPAGGRRSSGWELGCGISSEQGAKKCDAET